MSTHKQPCGLPTTHLRAPHWCPPGAVLADARLVVQGVSLPWRRLGESAPLPFEWPGERGDVSAVCVTPPRNVLERLVPGLALVLVDDESRPVAALDGIRIEGETVWGTLQTVDKASEADGSPHPSRSTRFATTGRRRLGVVAARPPVQGDFDAVQRWRSTVADGEVLWFVTSAGLSPDKIPPAVVRQAVTAWTESSEGTRVLDFPLWWRDSERDSLLAARVTENEGVTDLLLLDADAYPMRAAPGPSVCATSGGQVWHRLLSSLRGGSPLPPETPTALGNVLTRWYPPRRTRGLVIFFTGFSGSGKSTVARVVAQRITDHFHRPVTLLDGDVVRTILSSGLGFDRAGRDANIGRIGFVATEVARHGGVAICAPIAPYAQSRQTVREMAESVGDFVLIHVSTPLEVCEGRDVKGLYARARAGLVQGFTGINDPYETPADADLTLDTTLMSEPEAVTVVMDLLVHGGWLAPDSES